ncbi:hypothetical protein, partial [Escherichia coli]|uniref:hypothetical protein n=1 Tax=Escherichia coli TaxID=562 RepID=UPI001BDBFF08
AVNVALDRHRLASRQPEVPLSLPDLEMIGPPSDDDVASFLERRATAASVQAALAALRAAGDITAYRVATYLLDQVELTGQMPSMREAGRALGISNVGATKALRRMRPYLAPLVETP